MKRYAVFAHYDSQQIVDDYVLYYLSELKTVVDEVVFVSDGSLSDREKEKLKQFTNIIISERHGEYDFGSYKRGIKVLEKKLSEGDQLVLCNDSVFGPFIPFKQIFDDMSHCDADMWGIIDSSIHDFLMSFFLVINSTAFLQDWFKEFFENVKQEVNKSDVVTKYEMGLSKLIVSKGQKWQSWFDTFELTKHKRSDLCSYLKEHNIPVKSFIPSKAKVNVYNDHNFYLQFMNFPFLKKLCFKDKSCFFPLYYKKVIKNYPCSLIERSVSRLYPSSTGRILTVLFYRYIKKIKKFVYQEKTTKSGTVLIKICRIPLGRRKVNV